MSSWTPSSECQQHVSVSSTDDSVDVAVPATPSEQSMAIQALGVSFPLCGRCVIARWERRSVMAGSSRVPREPMLLLGRATRPERRWPLVHVCLRYHLCIAKDIMSLPAGSLSLSRAAVRRLAHDAEQRFTKLSHEGALAEFQSFLERILSVCFQVARYTRRKAITTEHVYFAASALRVQLPPDLVAVQAEHLTKLQRSNIRAPAKQRKKNALHAELSEASFARAVKKIAIDGPRPLRLAASARRLLQLIAEQRLMAYFVDSHAEAQAIPPSCDLSTAALVGRSLRCTPEVGAEVAARLQAVLNQAPALLDLSNCNTVDERLIRAATQSAGMTTPDTSSLEMCKAEPQFLRVCDRILRGRLADKRVTSNAARALAQLLTFFAHQAGASSCTVPATA